MKQQNIKSQETQNLGGTSTMERQTFKVSEQTYNNLVTEAAAAGKSKSDFIREKLAMAAEYIDGFDFSDRIRHDSIDYLRTQLHERNAKGKPVDNIMPVDNIIEDILILLDERFAESKKLEEMFKPEEDLKQRQIPIFMSSKDNNRLRNISKRFRISKRDTIAAVINHSWND